MEERKPLVYNSLRRNVLKHIQGRYSHPAIRPRLLGAASPVGAALTGAGADWFKARSTADSITMSTPSSSTVHASIALTNDSINYLPFFCSRPPGRQTTIRHPLFAIRYSLSAN